MISEFTKYNKLFKNIIPNAVGGIRIFSKRDTFLKLQVYDDVTNLENRIWAELYQKLDFLLNQYATKEYLLGVKALPIPNSMFPKFEEISPLIQNSTDWTLVPVAGFLDEELFFDLNRKRQFPVTEIIRQSPRFEEKYMGVDIKNEAGYTPEPDIFHDIQGHIPFLMNKKYADFMWEVGLLGDLILKDEKGLGPDLVAHNLKRLQNFAWWTYEYGLIKNNGEADKFRRINNDIKYEIYGSGIISSYDEVMNVIKCSKGESERSKFLPYNIEEIAMTCFDYSEIQDRYYVIDSMDHLYESFKRDQDIFWFEG